MSGLRTVSTTFLVIGVVGVAGVKLMKIESIDDNHRVNKENEVYGIISKIRP